MNQKYFADDRGNIVQFYEDDEIVATLDREAGPNADQYTWNGGAEVTAWAAINGYPDIANYPRP